MTATPSPADLVSTFFAAVDRLDAEGVVGFMAEDAAAVDEVTKGWARGRAAVAAVWMPVLESMTSVSSQVDELVVHELGVSVMVTCRLRQTYRIDGVETRIDAPTTFVLRPGNEGWQIVLFHSVPVGTAA
ncbi:MAG: nuclear transport factor 2 family protein [Chthoniobacterales bacterium]|nr:nuclear transport factor 2 family protein [Chthoniobacterales bacterium]